MRDEGAGSFLSTRPRGQRTAAKLERLAAQQAGDVIIDFDGVEAATPPFLQPVIAAIGNIVGANPDTGRIVVVAGLNNDLYETLRFVSSRTKRDLAFVDRSHVEIVDDRPQIAETLRAASELNPFFTAPELAAKLDINPDTATQRLKRLVMIGVAERRADPQVERGRRHIYRVAGPELLRQAQADRRASRKRAAGDPVAA